MTCYAWFDTHVLTITFKLLISDICSKGVYCKRDQQMAHLVKQ